MVCRIELLATAIVAAASFASAQTNQPTLAKREQQGAWSKPEVVGIILDVSFLYFPTNHLDEGYLQNEALHLPKLPRMKTSIRIALADPCRIAFALLYRHISGETELVRAGRVLA